MKNFAFPLRKRLNFSAGDIQLKMDNPMFIRRTAEKQLLRKRGRLSVRM